MADETISEEPRGGGDRLGRWLVDTIYRYTRFFERLFGVGVRVTYAGGKVAVDLRLKGERSIDERLAQLERARQSLTEALNAVGELEHEAERSRAELEDLSERLKTLEAQKADAEAHLERIRSMTESDAKAMRQAMGLPSVQSARVSAVLAFFSGVFASFVTSGLVWLGRVLYDLWT